MSLAMTDAVALPAPEPLRRWVEDGVVEEYVFLEAELNWEVEEITVKKVRDAYGVTATYKCLTDPERGMWYGPTLWYSRTTHWKPCGVTLSSLTSGVTAGFWVQWWNTGSSRHGRRSRERADRAEAVPVPTSSSSESSYSGSDRSRSSRRHRRRARRQQQPHSRSRRARSSRDDVETELAAQMARALINITLAENQAE